MSSRCGTGYDVHRLVEGRKLILGGVRIEHEKGLLGHSDADVLTHAIIDAILGAMALGSIGDHFPDDDPSYKDISSLDLLERVRITMEEKGYGISNIDSTVICDAPKLAGYIDNMRMNLSEGLRVPKGQVSVKATTTEGLSFTGTGEGIAAQAICSLYSLDDTGGGEVRRKRKPRKSTTLNADDVPGLPNVEYGSMKKVVVNIDGASDGNPGPSGIGILFSLADGTEFGKYCEFVGKKTSNQAEYLAAIKAADIALEWGVKELDYKTDSQLLERQLKGQYQVKNPGLAKLFAELKTKLSGFKRWRIVHVPRSDNKIADELSRMPLQKVRR